MNFEKSKILLKKINALHEAADQELGVSALEKDLMLQYVRDFYEAVKGDATNKEIRRSQAPNHKVKGAYHAPSPEPVNHEVIVPVHKTPIPPSRPTPEPVISEPVQENKISDDLNLLFNESENEESGSRYSGGKIADIGKSMGINDKILTINDLFKGDQSLFNKTIDHLNSLDSYEAAKTYLATGIAGKMNWADASKKGKAIRFINLMRRKYSA